MINVPSIRQLLEEREISFSSLQYPPMFITVAAIFFIYLLCKWQYSTSKGKNPPPSPPKLPIIGNLHQVGICPHRSLQALSQRCGPLMLLHLGKARVLVVSSSDAAREIMRTHDLIFASRPKTNSFEKLVYNGKDVAIAPYGEYWRQMRSVCVLHLLSNKMVQSFRGIRADEISLMIEKIKNLSLSSLPVNLNEIILRLTNDVICRVALGRKYNEGEEGSKFKELLENLVELLGGFNVSDYIPSLGWLSYLTGLDAKLERVAKEVDDFLEGVIGEHEEKSVEKGSEGHVDHEEGQKDFVDVLLRIQKDETLGFPIDRVGIKAVILDMFAAGTDTSFAVLEWGMSELLKHQNVMKKLQAEVRGIAGENCDIREEDLNKMHYLKAVIKEILRLHMPLPLLLPRESTKDIKINGYDISIGTKVIVNSWAIGRDPTS